jgi:uncharacterized protein (DUF2252 family)
MQHNADSRWLPPAARTALGRAARKQTPRTALADFNPAARIHATSELLAQSNRGRLPALAALKRTHMLQSPFAYFRGSVPVMAADLAHAPHTGLDVQLCGDAHVSNLGSYIAPDGLLVFDINDFDETCRGPFEWDLKRLAASIELAGSQAGSSPSVCARAVHACLAAYTHLIAQFAQMPALEAFRFRVHRLEAVKPVASILHMALRATPEHSLARLTVPAPHSHKNRIARRFRTQRPNLWRVTGREAKSVLASLSAYSESLLPEQRHLLSRYRPIDVGFKVVGTGSIGLRDYVVLLEGNGPADPLFLQIKQETSSAYAAYLPAAPADESHHGRRVALGTRLMQLQSDPFLGWTAIGPHHYLVRQLKDHKAAIDITRLRGTALVAYAQVCGELLARSHARSADAAALHGYIGSGSKFTRAIAAFARAYATQTIADWRTFSRTQ